METERVQELERKLELERKRVQDLEKKLRMEEERRRDGTTNREGGSAMGKTEPNVISFDSEDVPQSPLPPSEITSKPTQSQMEVAYDDFSVRKPVIEVDFDDFSVKPRRWGSKPKVDTSAVVHSRAADTVDEEEVEPLVPLDVSPLENKVPELVERPASPEPFVTKESLEEEAEEQKSEEEQRPEEEQLISMEVDEEEKERETEEETQRDEVREDDKEVNAS